MNDQLKAWKAAIAAHNKTLRNRRGHRNRDPYRRAILGVRKMPAAKEKETHDDDDL